MKKLLVILGMMLLVSSVHAVELKVVTEDFPPFNYKERDKITGMSTEVVQEVLKEVGIKTKIEVYPWVRSYKMALNNKNILIYSIARTKHREKLFKWIGNISPYNVYIYKLKSRDDIKFDSLESAKKYIFGGVKEDVKQQYLSKKGFKVDLSYTDEISIKKLLKGRIDLILYDEIGFAHKIRELGFNANIFKKILFLEEISGDLYMAFSKSTSDTLVEKFEQALMKVKKAGTYEKIQRKYLQ